MTASVFAGLAVNGPMLIAARFVQGIGAAMILPTTLSSLNALFTGRARVVAFAVYGSAIGGMAALGPLIGGWLATDYSWRWAFWLNIPVGLLVVLGIVRALPETRDLTAAPGRDLLGVALSMIGMGAIVFALIEAQTFGWWRTDSGGLSPVPLVLAGGVIALVVFVLARAPPCSGRRAGARRPATVRHPDLRAAGVVAALIVAFGEFGLLFTLPLLLQGTLGYSALQTGWVIVASWLLEPSSSPERSRRSRSDCPSERSSRSDSGSRLSQSALWPRRSPQTSRPGCCAPCSSSTGSASGWPPPNLTSLLLHDVPVGESGARVGPAVQRAPARVGPGSGSARRVLFIASLGRTTQSNLAALSLPTDVVDRVTAAVTDSAGTAIAGLQAQPGGAAIAQAAGDAMIHASRLTTGLAAIALVVGLLATFRLPRSAD